MPTSRSKRKENPRQSRGEPPSRLPFTFRGSSRLLTVPQLAKRLKTSRDHLYKLVQFNRIPYLRINALIRFQAHEIEKWLAEQAGGPR